MGESSLSPPRTPVMPSASSAREERHAVSGDSMKKRSPSRASRDMRPEYDFASMKGGVRGKYRIALCRSDEGYAASVPGLPGCWSQGLTEEEAMENIGEAIREYLAAVEE